MGQIAPQPGIMDIALYQGGLSQLPGVANVVKLSSNENPYGPSPAAIDAVRGTAGDLHLYPSTDHAALRAALAARHGLDADRIVCGVGSDEIIALLCQAYAGPGDEVIHTEHGFAMYRISALAAGATPVEVPERDRRVDIDAILSGCTARTRIVFLTNPGNPTGTMIPGADIARLASALPGDVLLVLDGAYTEYVADFDGGAALVEAHENLVMTRTFSKLYGLGGMRVGWAYGARAVIDVVNRIRGPFNLSVPALAAAEAALGDTAHVAKSLGENTRLRVQLTQALTALGIGVDESHTNFILARFASASEADAADAHLKAHGLIVRKMGGYKLPQALRITVGDAAACERVIGALTTFREAAA